MKAHLPVSIVINTLNRADLLDRTLTSLRQLRYSDFEVLVVNGPSSDHTPDVLARHADTIRVGHCAEANLAKSRNIGIAMARGDIVAFIDDDAVPEPDWLDQLISPYADPIVAAAGGFIRNHAGIDYQCKVVIADRFGDSKSYEKLEGELTSERYLSLTGTNSSFRRATLMQEGGFDEEYAYFLDETDVNVRLVDRGWKASIVPEAEVHHKFAASHLRMVDRIPKSMYVTARSKAYFCCVNAGKAHSLAEIVSYLARFINAERRWKKQMYFQRQIDKVTSDRLIAEVEKGVADGARDAYAQSSRQLLSTSLLAQHESDQFKRFPLPKLAEKRMRICFLSQDYPPIGNGGIGQWTREVAIGLGERGHEVTVISRSDVDHSYVDFVDGVWLHRIHPRPASEATARSYQPIPTSLLNYSAAVLGEIRRIQPRREFQVVSGPIWDLEPLVTLKESGLPTVVSLHTTYKLALPHKPDWASNAEYRRRHIDPVIEQERGLLASAPFLLSNTHALANDIRDQYGIKIESDRLTVVPHGLSDLAACADLPVQRDSRFRILFVGRLEKRKGADLLLSILPQLLSRHPQVLVDIIGDDKIVVDGDTLRARFLADNIGNAALLDRVAFYGIVSRETLLRHYRNCDLVVTPSRYESFGLIFVEAMMFGKASVGIAAGGVPEVVTDGKDGALISRDDAAELSTRISQLVDNPRMLASLGTAARRTFEQRFTVQHMLNALENYYSRVAAQGCSFMEMAKAG